MMEGSGSGFVQILTDQVGPKTYGSYGSGTGSTTWVGLGGVTSITPHSLLQLALAQLFDDNIPICSPRQLRLNI
jgi:hypothetical protein